MTNVTPPQLSLIRRPFNIQEIAEFVHHLGADVEFVATDTNDHVYGGITRLQLIELLKLVPVPPCKICGENHGGPRTSSRSW